MAEKNEKKYVVLGNFVRHYTRGDVVSAGDLAGDGVTDPDEAQALADAMVAEKSIRPAAAWEAKRTSVPVEYLKRGKDGKDLAPSEKEPEGLANPEPLMAGPGLIVPEKKAETEKPAPQIVPKDTPAATQGTQAKSKPEGKAEGDK